MKSKKRIRKLIILIIGLIIIAAVILNIIMFYESSKVYQTEELGIFVKVDNYTGFNVDTGALYFGTVPASGKATRLVRISNLDKASRVILTAGGLAEWIILPNGTLSLNPGESIELPVTLAVPANTPIGEYSGKLTIRFVKP